MLLPAGVLTERRYREHDERASTRIQVALESGILPNGQKTVENQFSAQASRRASERRKIHERAAKNDARDQLEERLKTLNLEKQALNEQLKDIKGSSPRKKRSANSRSSSSTTSLAPSELDTHAWLKLHCVDLLQGYRLPPPRLHRLM